MKVYFVRNIPKPHPVHQAFAESVGAEEIAPAPDNIKYILNPLYNIIRLLSLSVSMTKEEFSSARVFLAFTSQRFLRFSGRE